MTNGKSSANKKSGVEQSDVTFWGMGALGFGAIAVLSTALGAVLPQNFWVGLHSNRLAGGNLNQLRAEVTQLRDQQLQMRRQATQLRSRLVAAERGSGDVIQRVGALESSIPMLLEVVPPGTEIDRSLFTASIGTDNQDSISFDAEGGSVTLTQRPMFEQTSVEAVPEQSMPSLLSDTPPTQNMDEPPTTTAELASNASDEAAQMQLMELASDGSAQLIQTQFGIALGDAVTLEAAGARWQDLSSKIGTLLIGLNPAVSDPLGDGSNRIVVGPIQDYAEAEMLCLRISRVGINCLPVQFESSKLVDVQGG